MNDMGVIHSKQECFDARLLGTYGIQDVKHRVIVRRYASFMSVDYFDGDDGYRLGRAQQSHLDEILTGERLS